MSGQGSDRQVQRGAIIGAVEDTIIGVARVGYGILGISLQLLPEQLRASIHNALRDLGHGVAGLPRNLAELAGAEIDHWEKVEPKPARAAPMLLPAAKVTSVIKVETAPAVPPVAKPTPAPAAPAAKLEPTPTPAPAPAPAPAAKVEPAPAPAAKVTSVIKVELTPVAKPEPTPVAKAEPTPVAKPVPTPVAAVTTGVDIAHIECSPPGRDVEGEYVLIWNTNDVPVDLTGWTLSNGGSKQTFTFPTFSLAPGAEVKLWTKRGKNESGDLYWNSRKAVWNSEGDTGTLKNAGGATASVYTYTGKKS